MEPVVYDFAINPHGTFADAAPGRGGAAAAGYYALVVPTCCASTRARFRPPRRAELDRFGTACRTRPELAGMVADAVRPPAAARGRRQPGDGRSAQLADLLEANGFDRAQHEHIRADLQQRADRPGQNRLPRQHRRSRMSRPTT